MKRLLPCVILMLSACTHSIHQVYVSAQDPKSAGQGEWVTVDTKELVVLGFQTETQYVEQAWRALENKCPGRIAQVTTEHLTSYKFLSYEQKLVLKGLCLKS
jgi:hypothetical protein